MLWLVTFVAVVPLGLVLAHRERLSFRKLSAESQLAEETSTPPSAASTDGAVRIGNSIEPSCVVVTIRRRLTTGA